MNQELFSKSPLFMGVSENEREQLFPCIWDHESVYKKEETVFSTGDIITQIGFVLSGGIHIINYDLEGHARIIGYVGPGEFFGEAYACAGTFPMMVDVIACETTHVLFFDAKKMMQTCERECHFHQKVIENLLVIMARKNLGLTRKINHISYKTIRERLMDYLKDQSLLKKSCSFEIAFDRQELADYLNVDRSAMSHELSKMKDDGLIDFKKKHFVLLKKD